jgi:tellurite resistance protein TerC
MTALLLKSIKQAKRLIIAVIGFTVLLTGIAMIVLPGPAIVVIPIGLAILATEYVWARRLLDRVKSSTSRVKGWVSKQ